MIFRPATFTSTEIIKYYDGYNDYIDNIGGYISSMELLLGLVAMLFWFFRPIFKSYGHNHQNHMHEQNFSVKVDGRESGSNSKLSSEKVNVVAGEEDNLELKVRDQEFTA